MPVELRKRKAPAPPPEPVGKKPPKVAKGAPKAKEAVTGQTEAKPKANGAAGAAKASTSAKTPSVGDTIDLASFDHKVTTTDGETTSLAQLVEKSTSGVVIFTYPKASTPGCTAQVCLFRDSYEPLTASGFSIYGLSRDDVKSNTAFKDKHKLPYPLLCDTSARLILAIGRKKPTGSTLRGVFAVDKHGKVLLAQSGSPAQTVELVKRLVESGSAKGGATEDKVDSDKDDDKADGTEDEGKADKTEESKDGE